MVDNAKGKVRNRREMTQALMVLITIVVFANLTFARHIRVLIVGKKLFYQI
jgi:hypothetical protein